MRCPGCNKFPAFNIEDLEVELDVDGEYESQDDPEETAEETIARTKEATAKITGTCRIVLTSECCGEECKEANLDVEAEVQIERAQGCVCDLAEGLEVEGEGMSGDRYATEDRNGKPIKSSRYSKHFYCADITIIVTCACGASKATVEWKDEVQAGEMDELN